MKDDNQPVTKKEFDEGMQMVANAFENVATKEDLKAYATKEDLENGLTGVKSYMRDLFEAALTRIEESTMTTLHNHEQRITTLERKR